MKGPSPDGTGAPDLASPAFKANPYPFYARLGAEAPVWRATLRDRRTAWLVTRYEDVARVLKDDAFAKDKLNAALRARRRGDWGHDDTARWTGLGGARLGQP